MEQLRNLMFEKHGWTSNSDVRLWEWVVTHTHTYTGIYSQAHTLTHTFTSMRIHTHITSHSQRNKAFGCEVLVSLWTASEQRAGDSGDSEGWAWGTMKYRSCLIFDWGITGSSQAVFGHHQYSVAFQHAPTSFLPHLNSDSDLDKSCSVSLNLFSPFITFSVPSLFWLYIISSEQTSLLSSLSSENTTGTELS